jgi:glycosyltransferase involved in cell wall biosynthesis
MSMVHIVLPNDVDDPAVPSGGNTYDRRICQGLAAAGWSVREHPIPGAWPRPDGSQRAELDRVLSAIPADAVVLLDGLVASAVPDVLAPQSARLRLVVLVHMPLEDDAEARALSAAAAIVTTSEWCRRRLLDRYALPADRIRVARPGVEPAQLAVGSDGGANLLCVAAVTAHKGHDLLTEALAMLSDLPWTCVCVGTLTRDPRFVDRLRGRIRERGLAERVRLAGPCTGARLAAAYAGADLLVLASRGETYGMVVTEALSRGIPALTTAVGGLAEAVGRAPDGSRPGMLVAPEDPRALAGALRRWLTDPDLRRTLRRSAVGRRSTLAGWTATTASLSAVLAGVAPMCGRRT